MFTPRQQSSRTRNSVFYFPAREGRGLGCLLPRLSEPGLELLASMLVYDPENRAAARKLLEHRYFVDLRYKLCANVYGPAYPARKSSWIQLDPGGFIYGFQQIF